MLADGIDPHARRLLDLLAAARSDGGPGRDGPSVERRRQAVRDLARLGADPPLRLARIDELDCRGETPGSSFRLRRYVPPQRGSGALVYVHGGGWVAGDLDTHDGVCRALALASGRLTVAVDYRRPPEHRCPAALIDVLGAVAFVRAQADAWGVDPETLVLAGDSAGGNIVAGACLLARDRGEPAVALQVLICPILDLSGSRPSRSLYAEGYFLDRAQFVRDLTDYTGGVGANEALSSPLAAPDLRGLPPAHVHVAEFDPFRDEGLAYAERLGESGVEARSRVHRAMIHYFYALPRIIPYARSALAEIGAGLGQALEADRPART